MNDKSNAGLNGNLKQRNRAVLLVLLAVIALIFAITIVKIKVEGQAAVATPSTPYGKESGQAGGEPDFDASGGAVGDLPADKPISPPETSRDGTDGRQQ